MEVFSLQRIWVNGVAQVLLHKPSCPSRAQSWDPRVDHLGKILSGYLIGPAGSFGPFLRILLLAVDRQFRRKDSKFKSH